MPKLIKKVSKKTGLPPGTLVHIGEKKTEKPKITIIDYNESEFQEKVVESVEECFPFKEKPTVTWINIDGLHQVDIIEKIGECFSLHPLLLEDILNTNQRPKIEDYEDYLFIVFKMLYFDEKGKDVILEQVSLVLNENCIISFQEQEGDVFNIIRDRLRTGKGRSRKMGADYLAYSLIDTTVDSYFTILEKIGEKIETLEEPLVKNPTIETLQSIHNLKRDLIFLRKSVWPLREVISGLQRTESLLIRESTGFYLRDLYDHTIRVIDTLETFRDMISGMIDIYVSSMSNKLNEVMKVLTIIATIFIPLTFIAGVYGMNFKFMPETEWRWGYFAILLFMVTVGLLMVFYFKRRKWL